MIVLGPSSARALVPYRSVARPATLAAPMLGAQAVLPAVHAASLERDRAGAPVTPRRRRDDVGAPAEAEASLLTQLYASRRRRVRVSASEGAAAYDTAIGPNKPEAGAQLALIA